MKKLMCMLLTTAMIVTPYSMTQAKTVNITCGQGSTKCVTTKSTNSCTKTPSTGVSTVASNKNCSAVKNASTGTCDNTNTCGKTNATACNDANTCNNANTCKNTSDKTCKKVTKKTTKKTCKYKCKKTTKKATKKTTKKTCKKTPVTKTPATKTPVTKVPVTKAPATKVPATKTPVTATPATKAPATKAPTTTAPATAAPAANTDMVQQVVDLVNSERAKQGLSSLTLQTNIQAAAQVRAKEITTSFAHTRPNGSSFSTALTEAGVKYSGCGENIAWGQKTAQEVMNGWMNSSGHRANILSKNYKNIGVGYYVDQSGRAYWTQLFTY